MLDEADDVETHIADTLIAGLACAMRTVRYVVEEGPSAVDWLVEQGVASIANERRHRALPPDPGGRARPGAFSMPPMPRARRLNQRWSRALAAPGIPYSSSMSPLT